MTADIATNEPREQRAGMTWQWTRTLADYPAPTWTLKYWFKKTGSSGANFSITATASGVDHAVSVAAATTQGYTAGDYTWAAVVTAGSEAFEVDHGTLKLLPRYDQAANVDDRSHARKMLANVEAALEALNLGMKSYTIGTRDYTARNIDELTDLRAQYRGEVHAEEVAEDARNGFGGNKLVVRF